jgi:tRNA uridine 5-carboxymethylaminomethyl modification enzyme
MLTSRAEYRLLLRHNNADERLTPWGRELNLVKDEQWEKFQTKRGALGSLIEELKERKVKPDVPTRAIFEELGEALPSKSVSLAEIMRRPSMNSLKIARLWSGIMEYNPETRSEAESTLLYAGYLNRQEELAARNQYLEDILIDHLDFNQVHGLSREGAEKLSSIRPRTLAQAARISGITPAALNCIEIQLRKMQHQSRGKES